MRHDTCDENTARDADKACQGGDQGLGELAQRTSQGERKETAIDKDPWKWRWLERQALSDISHIIDCDPNACTVQMEINGKIYTRRIAERFTRVMGYHRPVSAFNPGKQSEHADRKFFNEFSA